MSDFKPYDDISMEHAAAIGRVVITWADFELSIDLSIWELMGVDQQIGACVTSQFSSMFHRMNALISLCDEVGVTDELCKQLSKLAGSLSGLSEYRNRVVHDARFAGTISKRISRFQSTAKKKLVLSMQDETVESLLAGAKDIYDKRSEYTEIWRAVSNQLIELRSQPKQREQKLHWNEPRKAMPKT